MAEMTPQQQGSSPSVLARLILLASISGGSSRFILDASDSADLLILLVPSCITCHYCESHGRVHDRLSYCPHRGRLPAGRQTQI